MYAGAPLAFGVFRQRLPHAERPFRPRVHLDPHEPVPDWRAAQWLPAYPIGLGVIVHPSRYGPLITPDQGDEPLPV